MASFNAKLEIEGKSFIVLRLDYKLFQDTDEAGKPTSKTKTEIIKFIVMASEDETFAGWATDATKQLDGKFVFYDLKGEAKFKEVAFEQAFCVEYHEHFMPQKFKLKELEIENVKGDIVYLFDIGISPSKLTVSGVTHDNGW